MTSTAPISGHIESHFESGALVRDVVIGMADGLTVPFALAAGLSGAVSSTHLIVLAGMAEIAAGSIAMGLGGFLAARGDAEHYASERLREEREIVERTRDEEEEIYEIFEEYGVRAGRERLGAGGAEAKAAGVGRFHDALRAWPGEAGGRARPAERTDHRALVYCGRAGSAAALYSDGARPRGRCWFRWA